MTPMSDHAVLRRLAGVAIDADLAYVSGGFVIDPATFYRPVLDLTERLEMAEGLLRQATASVEVDPEDLPHIWTVGVEPNTCYLEVAPHEAEYLRSLTGEGDS